MNVNVFKTSVADPLVVAALKPSLDKLVGAGQWNFDLADCDKILRIVSERVEAKETIALMNEMGFACTELD